MKTPRHDGPLLVLAIALTLGAYHVAGLAENFNDKAVHRAMAYFCSGADHTALAQRLHAAWPEGSPDPLERISLCGSYFLPNQLTLALEHLPLRSAFQSVFLAHLALHLLALGVATVAWRRVFQGNARLLYWGLLLSLLPWFFAADWAFPFSNSFFGGNCWRVAYPRGAATLLTFASATCAGAWLRERSRREALGWAVLCAAFAAVMHREVAAMNLVVVAGALVLPRVLGLAALPTDRAGWVAFFRRAAIATVLVCIVKTVAVVAYLHVRHGVALGQVWIGGMRAVIAITFVFAGVYFWLTRALVLAWSDVRSTASDDTLRDLGDTVVAVLLPFALLSIALYPFQPTSHEWIDGPMIVVYEASRRLISGAQIAWFVLLALYVAARWPAVLEARFAALGASIFVLLNAVSFMRDSIQHGSLAPIRDASQLTTRLDDVLSVEPTSEEGYRIYQAVANELRGR